MALTHSSFAEKLANVDPEEQILLIQNSEIPINLSLAHELRQICYESWYSSPEKTRRVISALNLLSNIMTAPEVRAIAIWSSGIGDIINGKMRSAIKFLDEAEQRFLELNQPIDAAETQVSKIYALAMLGLYEPAIDCGLRVRQVFLRHQNFSAAGKIELNLGNIYQKRDQYEKAEKFLRSAKQRFSESDDTGRLIQIDNSLANALAHQHRFAEAEKIYLEALRKAEADDLQVLKAEIESNLGHLLLFQGRLDRALKFFESSRRRYSRMGMPHQSAIAEQEIADAYLELNLIPEASEIYRNVIKTFADLELKSDKARAMSFLARARIEVGQNAEAHELLAEATAIYRDEMNSVGLGIIMLIEAKLYFSEHKIEKALTLVQQAEPIFTGAGLLGRALHARWLCGEAFRSLEQNETARKIFTQTLAEANDGFIPQLSLRCLTSLGMLCKADGDVSGAMGFFREAIALVEEMRSPLPAEDFRVSFLADKLTPYDELIGLLLNSSAEDSIKDAFVLAENARSRVLLEMLGFKFSPAEMSESRRDLSGFVRLEQLREEINWLYNQLNKLSMSGQLFDVARLHHIQGQIRTKEYEFLEIKRKQAIFSESDALAKNEPIDLKLLQSALGENRVLVEFLIADGNLSAFIVSNDSIECLRNFCAETDINHSLDLLNLQIDRMRYQSDSQAGVSYVSNSQSREILKQLYDSLIRPLEASIKEKDLIIVPQKNLHYVPFQALFDGLSYLVEKRGISFSPSARIFLSCLEKEPKEPKDILFVGVNDRYNPKVALEIETLARLFPECKTLINAEATRSNLQRHSGGADVVHLACHGKFRPDNPMFSSIKLSDGWFNVGDAYTLDLNSSLVVLSACETGLSSIAVGDEILGLARGFFSAGASALVLSLWQVDDLSTQLFMESFYQKLKLGLTASAALRMTQVQIMQHFPHPFYWAPFFLIGRP